jgi:hypothetical protein
MIVIGLGTGRSGTASLSMLLNAQPDASCFHELNPSAVRFYGTPRPVLNTIDEFQAVLDGGDPAMVTVDLSRAVCATVYDRLRQMKRVRLIGDIAFYYLSYVQSIADRNPNVRFICLRRDREETIESWMRYTEIERSRSQILADRLSSWITREPYRESRNFWMEHDGTRWLKDPVWDKCFPKFTAPGKRDALRQYWDYYYETAEAILQRLPDRFRIIETNRLDDGAVQRQILDYCGVPEAEQVLSDVHINRSRNA